MKAKFGIYFHDTGTGKTCQIISQISSFQKVVLNFLVLIPNSTIVPQFQHDLIKSCTPFVDPQTPFNIFVSTLHEATTKSFVMPAGKTAVFFDEAHSIKGNTALKVYALGRKFDISHAFALTATPMIDSPRELINILGSMALLAGVDVSDLPSMRLLDDHTQFETKFKDILLYFRSKGALLSRNRLKTNNVAFPTKDVSQSYFDPYTMSKVSPLKITTSSLNAQRNASIRKNITIEKFQQYGKIAWNSGFQNATRMCLNDKLPTIAALCKRRVGKSPVLIYSKFKENGVHIIYTHLVQNGFKNVSMLTGDSPTRTIIAEMRKYNSIENRNGSLTQVMLITGRMATGYNFRNTQLMVLVEPDYNPGTLQQAMGRVIRRNIFNNTRGHVTVVGLMSTSPDKNQMTLDEQLYSVLLSKLEFIRIASRVFDQVSYEKIGLAHRILQIPERPANAFNLTSALQRSMKLNNKQVKNYEHQTRTMMMNMLQAIKNKSRNQKILNQAQREVKKLDGCLKNIQMGGNNPLEEQRKVCNLKSIKNKLNYLYRISGDPQKNRSKVSMSKKRVRLLK